MSSAAHAASEPQLAGQIRPLPSALAPMAAGSAPRDRAYRAIEGQFADRGIALDGIRCNGARRDHQRERDGEVEVAAFLGQVGRREIDGDVPERQRHADGVEGIADALAAFRDSFIREADDGEYVPPAADPDLHFDGARLDADEREGGDLPVHPRRSRLTQVCHRVLRFQPTAVSTAEARTI